MAEYPDLENCFVGRSKQAQTNKQLGGGLCGAVYANGAFSICEFPHKYKYEHIYLTLIIKLE